MDRIDELVKDINEGLIIKAAEVEVQDVTESDLKKINKFALSPLDAEEVFTFKTVLGDNETDDRNYEPFNRKALKDLEKLYVGKTVIKDHSRTADNQVARIYDTELVTNENKLTGAGEPFTKLVAKCYMVKTASNADLITDIKAGIKKEVSTSVRPKKMVCNICGVDNTKSYCAHWPGQDYQTKDGPCTCLMTIDGAKEAYELSLVAVPAQPRAGTTKHYGGKPAEPAPETEEKAPDLPENEPEIEENTPEIPVENPEKTPENEAKDREKDSETSVRVRALESFIFAQNLRNIEILEED